MDAGEQIDAERLQDQLDRLQEFMSSLDDINETNPVDFREKACEAWQVVAFAEPPPPATPAILVILLALQAFTNGTAPGLVDS